MIAGFAAHFAAVMLLLYAVFTVRDLAGTLMDPRHLDWLREMRDTRSGGWYVLQAISLLSGVVAGRVAIALSPPRSRLALGILLFLFLCSTFFSELPVPRSALLVGIWALATPVGTVIGAYLGWRAR